MDWLILRRVALAADPRDIGETLIELWPKLPRVSLVEFKSASKGYRSRDLDRLLGYGHQYYSANPDELAARADLALVLMVGERNRALDDDVSALGLRETRLERGYSLLEGGAFKTVLVDFEALVARLPEEYVALFAGAAVAVPTGSAAARWWYDHFGPAGTEDTMNPQELEEYEAAARRFAAMLTPEQHLAMLTPEQRLAGLAPEKIAATLRPEHIAATLAARPEAEQVLALPDALLRLLPDDYIATLPDGVQAKVRLRRGR